MDNIFASLVEIVCKLASSSVMQFQSFIINFLRMFILFYFYFLSLAKNFLNWENPSQKKLSKKALLYKYFIILKGKKHLLANEFYKNKYLNKI